MSRVTLTRSTDLTTAAVYEAVTWDTADEDGATFFDGGAPSRITVPSGTPPMDVYLTFNAHYLPTTPSATTRFCRLMKNGVEIFNQRWQHNTFTYHDFAFCLGPVSVTGDDYFEIEIQTGEPITYAQQYLAFSLIELEASGFLSTRIIGVTRPNSTAVDVRWWGANDAADVVDTLNALPDFDWPIPVPPNTTHALVRGQFTILSGSAIETEYRIKKNGTAIRIVRPQSDGMNCGSLGLIPVTDGDVLLFEISNAASMDVSQNPSHLSIEWFEGVPFVFPFDGNCSSHKLVANTAKSSTKLKAPSPNQYNVLIKESCNVG